MYYLYIIKSYKDSKFYTGITDNIDRRVEQHNKGNHATPSTLNRGPFKLMHVEIASNRIEARKLENFFKSGIGREIRDEIAQTV